MKRIWSVWILFACVAAVCVFGLSMTHVSTGGMTQSLSAITAEIQEGRIENALFLSQEMKRQWSGYHNSLCTFLGHERLEVIDRELSALPVYLSHGEEADAAALCAQLQEYMEQLNAAEVPTLENIL